MSLRPVTDHIYPTAMIVSKGHFQSRRLYESGRRGISMRPTDQNATLRALEI
jgi:hypothetical protein